MSSEWCIFEEEFERVAGSGEKVVVGCGDRGDWDVFSRCRIDVDFSI